MKKYIAGSIVAASLLLYTGCGGGDDSTTPSTSTTTYSTGVFVDAPVAGLDYNCSSGSSGTTNSRGEFQYAPNGDICSFKAGNVPLGEANASKIVTPKDLFGLNDFNDTRVINLAAFLWSLDSDNNVTNGIQIDSAVATTLDVNITDPHDLFDDIEELFEQFFDDDENFAQEINTTLLDPTMILTHLEDSEMEAEYLYNGLQMSAISRSDIENKKFTIYDDDETSTLSFYGDGSVEFSGELDDFYGQTSGTWTIMENYLVVNLNPNGNAFQIFIAFQSLSDTEARFIAVTPDGLEAERATVTSINSMQAINFDAKALSFSDIAGKSLYVDNYLTANFDYNGSYSDSDGYRGYWGVVADHVVLINNSVSYIAIEQNASLETNSTFMAYSFSSNEAQKSQIKVLGDINSTQPTAAFDDRVAISPENFKDKLYMINNSNISFGFEYDGEFKMYRTTDNSEIAEGGWTIIDNYLVLTGLYKDSDMPFVEFVAFKSISDTNAEFISLTKNGIIEGNSSISVYYDDYSESYSDTYMDNESDSDEDDD